MIVYFLMIKTVVYAHTNAHKKIVADLILRNNYFREDLKIKAG